MKIKAIDQSDVTREEKQIFDIYLDLLETHGKVFIYQIEGESFIYRPIGRKDFIRIFTSEDLTIYDREEIVCETCVLYPENYDFEECGNGGLPTLLSKEILNSSYVSSDTQLENLMNYFREDMLNIQNQISCMIQEAFPNLSYDDIENFDMETTLKYLSRAEWILTNLRNMPLNYDPFSGKPWEEAEPTPPQRQNAPGREAPRAPYQEAQPQNAEDDENYIDFIPGETIEERFERLKTQKIKKEVLSPDKLDRLQRIAPQINWQHQNTEEDFNTDSSRI